MVKRRVIRVLTVQTGALLRGPGTRGRDDVRVDQAFEKQLNEKLGNKVVTVHVIAMPVAATS